MLCSVEGSGRRYTSQAHANKLDCEAAAADCRYVILRVNEVETIGSANGHIQDPTAKNPRTKNSETTSWKW